MELFDWYWLGVSAGLGVAAGTAAAWIQSAGPRVLGAIAFAVAALVGIFVAFFVAGWGPAIWAGAATVAFIPLVGYLEAVITPLVGGRLRRRAGEKYAGLRVLAKD
jgi:hypothetical protein